MCPVMVGGRGGGGNFYDPRQSNFGDKVHYYHSYMK